ncbi:hypothetical protein T484DRAFT_1923352 [Baffinella frigidus]|nr:hypothetical protein T484DRAFT_1923352 [Cryptophyta sp. CCMP2293]
MAESNWLDEDSSMFNDPSSTDDLFEKPASAAWATTGRLSRAVSCSNEEDTGACAKGAPRSRAVFVDRSILDNMTHLPREKAAQMLGLCSTTFKKVCRRAGLKGWPYRRPLLGSGWEGDAPTTFSRGSSAPSSFQETPHRFTSSPGLGVAVVSSYHASPQPPALPSMMPPCYVNLPSPSFSSFSSFSSSSSSMAAAATPASNGQNTHVVDAVMDYLDSLSSGCATQAKAARHLSELEAVVEGLDLEG